MEDIQEVTTQDAFVVSLDACIPFINISLSKTIDIAVKLIFEKNTLKFRRTNEVNYFVLLRHKHISILMEKPSIKLTEQPSPLGSAWENLFMGYNEQKWLESDHIRLVKFYRRYVDHIFSLFENEHQALNFPIF